MMLKIDFEAGGSMPGGYYIKWEPCTYPRDPNGKWVTRKSDTGRRQAAIIFRRANAREDDIGFRSVRVKFMLNDSWAKNLLLALAQRHGVKRYCYNKMPFLTVVLDGPEFNLIGLIVKYSELYHKLFELLSETKREFFQRRFGRDFRNWR